METAQMRGILAAAGFLWHENEGSSYYYKTMPWATERIVLWNHYRRSADTPQLDVKTNVCFQQRSTERPNGWGGDHRTVTWPTFEKLLLAIQGGAYQLCEHPNEILTRVKPPLPPQQEEVWVTL